MNPDLAPITDALNRLVAALHKGTWDYISTIAIVVTLVVLIWYTCETYRLRKAAQRQNEISVMPMLAVVNESSPDRSSREAVLKSVGSGPAFNLSIDRRQFGNGELLIEHDGNVMTAGQVNELRFQFREGNSSTVLHVDTLYEWINNGKPPDPLDIVVRCRSVNSVDYAFTFRLTPDAGGTGRLKLTFEGVVT